MKRIMTILCALLMLGSALAASAEVPVSNLYRPNTSETFRALVGGKSFDAGITDSSSIGEDEDTKYTITLTVYERDRFDAAVIENLAKGDILAFGNGTTTMIMEVTHDAYGTTAKGSDQEDYSFWKTEEGTYIASTVPDYPLYTEVFTVKVPLPKDIIFLDWSDPENLDEPVKLGYDALLDNLLDGTDFAPYNTRVTFDENGKLIELLYQYSPWN